MISKKFWVLKNVAEKFTGKKICDPKNFWHKNIYNSKNMWVEKVKKQIMKIQSSSQIDFCQKKISRKIKAPKNWVPKVCQKSDH